MAITETGDILVGTPAKRQVITNPDFTIRSAKLKLGTDWSITRGAVRLATEHILRRLREDAEAYIRGPLDGAALTVPANFDLDQRAALLRLPTELGSVCCGSSTSLRRRLWRSASTTRKTRLS